MLSPYLLKLLLLAKIIIPYLIGGEGGLRRICTPGKNLEKMYIHPFNVK